MITKRQGEILKIIIEEYSNKRQPVGSKYIVEHKLLDVSSATIRNEMAFLEKNEFIKKANSSSGRIPLEKAYDYYNKHLISKTNHVAMFENLVKQANQINASDIHASVDLISQITNHAAIYVKDGNETIMDIKQVLIDENSIILILITSSGEVYNQKMTLSDDLTSEKLNQVIDLIKPEITNIPICNLEQVLTTTIAPKLKVYVDNYELILDFILNLVKKLQDDSFYLPNSSDLVKNSSSIEELKAVYEFLENPLQIINGMDKDQKNIITKINEENNTSIVSLRIKDGENNEGVISVVGPRNMDYKKTAEILNFVKEKMEENNE